MPSPVPDRPGLLIRDSLHYSGTTLIIPPVLVECLRFFDGEATELDLRQMLVQATGDLRVSEAVHHLVEALSQAGFLEDEVYTQLREEKHRTFAESPVREAAYAGLAYPGETDALRARLEEYVNHRPPEAAVENLIGIAAPHVSFEGGHECYQAAYSLLRPEDAERTFVILGTSHHGQSEKFGLTRKPYVTPLGQATTDVALVDELNQKAAAAVAMEDYCHAVEHSIEFQVLLLQHLCGADIRILPVLCGPFGRSLFEGGAPEDDPGVKAFLGALGEIAAREQQRLFWILGIDLAHVGPRYGDGFSVEARCGVMAEVAERDRTRLERVTAGDADGFWEQVRGAGDDLRWCGASVLYTFLRSRPDARGKVLRYGQWNIDERSVVSFGAVAFRGEGYSGTAAIQ